MVGAPSICGPAELMRIFMGDSGANSTTPVSARTRVTPRKVTSITTTKIGTTHQEIPVSRSQ